MMQALADKLQIWGFEGDVAVFGDSSLGAAFRFEPLDIGYLEDDDINAIKQRLIKFLNALPEELEVQFVQKIAGGNTATIHAHSENIITNAHPFAVALTADRKERLSEDDKLGKLPRHHYFIFLRKRYQLHASQTKALSWLRRTPTSKIKPYLTDSLASFQRIIHDFSNNAESIGIRIERILQSDLAALVYQQWNPCRHVSLAQYTPDYLRPSLLFSDVVIDERGFSIADLHYRVLSLKLLPDVSFAAMASTLEQLPFDSELYVSLEMPSQHKEMETLKTQRRMAFSMANPSSQQVRDIESQNKFDELEALLEDLIAQGEKVYYAAVNVVIKADNRSTLQDRVAQALLKLRELGGAEAMEETHAAFDVYCELSMPNARARERRKRLKTSNLADFLPIYGTWRGHALPRTLLRHPNGPLFSFDPFSSDLTNANQLVSGSSGSGKSFLVNHLLLQLLKEDPRIYIIDIGGSYQKMVRLLGGQYLPLGLDQGLALNPFDLGNAQTEPSSHKIKFLLSFFETIAKEDGHERLPKLVAAELEAAIKQVYEKPASQHNISCLRDLLLKHPESDLKKIGRILGQWSGNTAFGSFLDRLSTVDLHQRLVCFDLKGLESYPDLQAVCLLLITDLVWREIQRDRQSMKFVVFDECWKLLENEAGATFIAENFRTFRKYYASAIAISQTMDDFANSAVSEAILPNSSIKWILSQKGIKQDTLMSVLNLNHQEVSCIQGLSQKKGEFSEAFLMAGDRRSLVRVESSPLEYWLATTDPRDLAAIDKSKADDASHSELAILKELAQRYPRGVLNGE